MTENEGPGLVFGREKGIEWIVTLVLFERPLEAGGDHGLYFASLFTIRDQEER